MSGNPSIDGSSYLERDCSPIPELPPDGTISGNHFLSDTTSPDGSASKNPSPDGSSSEDQSPDGLPSDGIPVQLRVDSARLELSSGYGDVALILNVFYGWCRADSRDKEAWHHREEDREAWCEEYYINTYEMRILWKAFQDLLKLIERETNVDLSWVEPVVMTETTTSTEDRMNKWTSLILRKCPELVYLHSGVPAQEYMNLITGKVEPLYLSRNFNFDTSVNLSEYVINFLCNVNVDVSTSTFRERKDDNLLTIPEPGLRDVPFSVSG